MRFLRRFFGKSRPPSSPPDRQFAPADDSERITAYDKYGRSIQIAKSEWRDKVLGPNLKKAWDRPDELYGLILGAFEDKLFAEVEEAARRLAEIDPKADRSATTLGIVYQQTGRAELAEETLLTYLKDHAEDAVVLTNLAKAQDSLGRGAEAGQTLWRALELDPNLHNALLWHAARERERGGEDAEREAFRRVALLPGSWRSQLWLARGELEVGDLEAALELYERSLDTAGEPAPADALQQISADLGHRGYLLEAIELVSPRYDYEQHGLQVGNNLIRAYYDLGQLDHARTLLTELQTLQRPDYQESLSYWENVLSKADIETRDAPSPKSLQVQVIPVPGPLWLKQDHPIARHFPAKAPDAPLIAFTGCTVEKPNAPTEGTLTQTDSAGRFSRALPLYLCERLHLETRLRSRAPIPWIVNHGGGFVVSSEQSPAEGVARLARMAADPNDPHSLADYAFDAHLRTQGENWTLQLRLIRSIDSSILAACDYSLPEHGFHLVAEQVLSELYATLDREAELELEVRIPPHTQVDTADIDHYLLRLEQGLAARCAVNLKEEQNLLQSPADILNGIIHLCIQNPQHIPSRFILWRTLDAVAQIEPELTRSFADKVRALMEEHRIEHPAYAELSDEIVDVLTLA